MTSLESFLSMGGYAGFVWPSYALAAVVLVAVLVASVRAARGAERDLDLIQQTRRARRGGQPES
ncbi:MAG: heme exporter protein CcmD [Pseudomonadota bacterium]